MYLAGVVALVVAVAGTVALTRGAEEYCYSEDDMPYSYFASKTMYEQVRNRRIGIPPVPNCRAVLVWGLIRHGTRYPHKEQIKAQRDLQNLRDNVLQNHNMDPHNGFPLVPGGGELCYSDVEMLKDWKYNVTDGDADLLTSSGVSELYLLAKRLKSDFPPLDATYTEDRFKIRFTDKERTKQSADAFTLGLFGNKIYLPDRFMDTKLLRPNHNCSSWERSTHSEGSERQTRAFRSGDLIKGLVSSVSRRLGFGYDLNFDVIEDVYNMCRFEKAWQQQVKYSPWCSAFAKEHLQILEYDEDLEYYYRSGYGNPFTAMLGCPLVADLINTFNNRVNGNGSEDLSTVLYFSHSLTLRAVLVRLGMAHDMVPITSSSFRTSERRQWRTSLISPFAGNLLAVLYKCNEQYKIMFYLNEQIIDYKGCDVGLCNWTYIYDRFAPIVNSPTCNLEFCERSGAPAGGLLSGAGLLVSLVVSLGVLASSSLGGL